MTSIPAPDTRANGQSVWTWDDELGDALWVAEENYLGAAAAVNVEATATGKLLDPGECRALAALLNRLADRAEGVRS